MTKALNIIIVLAMIALITTFVVSAISLQTKTDNILLQYSVKREELATKQQQIQDIIATLNSTIQTESNNQKIMAQKLNVTLQNTTVALPTTVDNTVTKTTTTTVTTPNPAPAPVISTPRIRRVTSAS